MRDQRLTPPQHPQRVNASIDPRMNRDPCISELSQSQTQCSAHNERSTHGHKTDSTNVSQSLLCFGHERAQGEENNSALSELSKVKRRVNGGSGSEGYFRSISMSFRKGSAPKNLEVFKTSERKRTLVWVTQRSTKLPCWSISCFPRSRS